jgi:signal transduction histidine kinase/CheY-like chemotaxis protein
VTDRSQAELALNNQLGRNRLLNEIVKAIMEKQDLESIFNVVVRNLEDHLPVDFASIWLCEAPCDFVTVVATGEVGESVAALMNVEKGAMLELKGTCIGAIAKGADCTGKQLNGEKDWLIEKFTRAGLSSLLLEPLLEDDHIEGFLVCGRKGGEFLPEDKGFLKQLSDYVVLAFRQKRLMRNLEHAYFELKRNQVEIMQQQRLKSLGQMASGIVHDINNALSPIVGYTDMILEDDSTIDPRTRGYLQNIRTAAEDISGIIGRMREFYREREGQEQLHPVELNRIAAQAVELTRPKWKNIQQRIGSVITVILEREENLPEILGVEGEIRESLINLMINAVDALPGDGMVTIRTRSERAGIVLEVIDTGAGMDEQTQEHCLEPFYTTKGTQGTGMGLSIVYGMIKRHSGELEIESVKGQGTTIRLRFPREPIPDRQGLESEEVRPMTPLRILCIDDESSVRSIIADMLAADKHEVITAESGQTGVQLFLEYLAEGRPFDVVITDLGMPYVGGREVVHKIKTASPRTPVVLMTGWLEGVLSEGDLARRMDHVMGKPPTMRGLREALHTVQGHVP